MEKAFGGDYELLTDLRFATRDEMGGERSRPCRILQQGSPIGDGRLQPAPSVAGTGIPIVTESRRDDSTVSSDLAISG